MASEPWHPLSPKGTFIKDVGIRLVSQTFRVATRQSSPAFLALAIEDHRKAEIARVVVEYNTSSSLLPATKLKQETHGGAAGVARQVGAESRFGGSGREACRRHKLVPRRRVVPCAHTVWIRRHTPHIRLDCLTTGDLVWAFEPRQVEPQHAARCTCGDVGEGYDRDRLVGSTATGEIEGIATMWAVRVTPLQDVDVGWTHGGACTGNEGCRVRFCVCGGSREGRGDADKGEGGGEVGRQMHPDGFDIER